MLQMYHNIVLQTWKAFVSTRRVIQDDDTRQITVDGRQIFGEASSIHFTMLGGNNKIISSLVEVLIKHQQLAIFWMNTLSFFKCK